MLIKIKLTFCLILLLFDAKLPQSIQGSQSEIKELLMNSNNISVLIYNYGSIGKSAYLNDIADFTWKGLGYMGEFGPIIAAEVTNENNEILNICSDSFINPGQGDYSPDRNIKWGWLPVPGYSNPSSESIANFKDPYSWPDTWQVWPDKNNSGKIESLNEAYFVMDDYSNAEFEYYPFGINDDRRGIGIETETRIYQYGDELEDAVFFEYTITNRSIYDLTKVYFGFIGDPHIGGYHNYSDDVIGILKGNTDPELNNTIYLWDEDMTGDGGLPSGILGFKLLTTPDKIGLNVLKAAGYTNSDPNVPRNDPLMWEWFESGIDSTSEFLLGAPGDQVILLGSGPFVLNAGETKEFKLAVYLSDDFENFYKHTKYITNHHEWPSIVSTMGKSGGNEDYKIIMDLGKKTIEGERTINWSYSGSDEEAEVYFECSPNLGQDWNFIAKSLAINKKLTWNSLDFKDGMNYIFRAVCYSPSNRQNYYYCNSPERYTINNPNENSNPELRILSNFSDTVFTISPVVFNWISEDADNSNLEVSIEYSDSETGIFIPIFTSVFTNGNNEYSWDIEGFPNWNNYFIKLTCTDGNSDSSLTIGPFGINIYQSIYSSKSIRHVQGKSTANLILEKVIPSEISDDEFRITFNKFDNEKFFTIKNITQNETVFENYPLVKKLSTPMFNGVKLLVDNKGTKIDSNLTTFNRLELNSTYDIYYEPSSVKYLGNPKIPASEDWYVAFNDLDTTSEGMWVNIGDEIENVLVGDYETIKCPFKILLADSLQPANYIIGDFNNNGQWDTEETIVLRRQNAKLSETSYALNFNFTHNDKPRAGDTLLIITDNEITENDVYHFSTDTNFVVDVKEIEPANNFQLHQNYPNPFNPSTTINYELPTESSIKLNVFNVLGEKIATLVNGNQKAGVHSVDFRGNNLASGVYIYTLKVDNKIFCKKMLLMK